jgi:hypothetical protein
MEEREKKRELGGTERGRMPQQWGRTAQQRACPIWHWQKKHSLNNDDTITGFLFEPWDEGKRYMKHLEHVISKWLAIPQARWIFRIEVVVPLKTLKWQCNHWIHWSGGTIEAIEVVVPLKWIVKHQASSIAMSLVLRIGCDGLIGLTTNFFSF